MEVCLLVILIISGEYNLHFNYQMLFLIIKCCYFDSWYGLMV